MEASSSRESSLKSARAKLKSYRARQNRASGSTSASSAASVTSKRASVGVEPQLSRRGSHAHKRSNSRGVSVVMPARTRHSRGQSLAAVVANASSVIDLAIAPAVEETPATPLASTSRRASRRHSRTDSILSVNDMVSPTPSSSGWTLPSSPQQSSTATFAAQQASRRANRQSLPYPMPSVPLSRSAGRPASMTSSLAAPRPVSLSNSASAVVEPTHGRKLSRHARRSSVASRRESMEIMSGVSLAVNEAVSPVQSVNSTSPSLNVVRERSDALDALEGRISPSSQFEPFDPTSLSNSAPSAPSSNLLNADKRASWTLNSSMTATGGKGALDLGMLVEEEEEDEGNATTTSPNATPQPNRVGRQRPASLFGSVPATSPPASTPSFSQPSRRPLNQSVSSVGSVTTPSEASRLGRRSLALNQSVHPGSVDSAVVPIGGRRRPASMAASKRSSQAGTFGDLVLAPSSPEPATIERLQAQLATAESRVIELDADLRLERHGAGDHAARLHESEGALAAARAELDAERAERAVELEKVRAELSDAIAERDDLRDDISGWRTRCSDSAKAIERLTQALEHERNEGALAREKARKLGDRLATANSAAPDAALASAQARLIGEMREQVISLATALDREKQAHAATQSALASATSSDPPSAPYKPLGTRSSIVRSDSDASSIGSMASFGARSFSNGNNAVDMSDEGMSFATTVATSSPQSSFSLTDKAMPMNALGVSVGGNPLSLDTLTEVSEEEYESTESTAVPSMLPGQRSPTRGSGSTCSVSSEPMPRTPIHESSSPQPEIVSEDEGHHPSHNRSDSFIKQWAFPKGPVAPLKYALHDDHSFWSIAGAQPLPPLPVDEQKHIVPPFFNSEITLDADYYSKRMSAPTLKEPLLTSPGPRPLQLARAASTPLPPIGRSASPAARMAPPPAQSNLSSSPARMSLVGGLGSLVSSYMSRAASNPLPTQPAPEAPSMVKASSGSSATTRGGPGFRQHQLPQRPSAIVPSPLNVLDFSIAAKREGGRILKV